jgi:hypothetical protein
MESRSGRIGCVRAGILVAIASMIPLNAVASQFPLGVIAQRMKSPPPPPVLINVPPPVSSGKPLPKVPVLANPGSTKRPQQPLPVSRRMSPSNERVYTAPQMNPFQSPSQSGPGRYRVIVENSSPSVLQRVRSIQPDAFAQTVEGRRIIQAGLFNTESRARQQVDLLTERGIKARVTTQPGQVISTERDVGETPQDEPLTASRESNYGGSYYVIIPGSRSKLPIYYSRTIQLGYAQSLVQLRDEPRGPYLSLGPFSNRRQAERVSGELRMRGNLDARVSYDR